eukprot:scaffold96516_cov15-Tisochrysis_lutea.AAC.1
MEAQVSAQAWNADNLGEEDSNKGIRKGGEREKACEFGAVGARAECGQMCKAVVGKTCPRPHLHSTPSCA